MSLALIWFIKLPFFFVLKRNLMTVLFQIQYTTWFCPTILKSNQWKRNEKKYIIKYKKRKITRTDDSRGTLNSLLFPFTFFVCLLVLLNCVSNACCFLNAMVCFFLSFCLSFLYTSISFVSFFFFRSCFHQFWYLHDFTYMFAKWIEQQQQKWNSGTKKRDTTTIFRSDILHKYEIAQQRNNTKTHKLKS